jgi:nondiscriminating aspartyl-tRNA synthetase
MAARVWAKDLSAHVGKTIQLFGWIHSVRHLGKLAFLILRDQTGLVQIIVETPTLLALLQQIQIGSVLSIRGVVQTSPLEVIQPQIEPLVIIKEAPLIEYNKPQIPSDLDFILDHRPLSLRNRSIQAVFKIQAEMAHAFRLCMHDTLHAIEYFGPNLLGASTEGGAEFFQVDYFDHTATLAQSNQLYKQIMVGSFERVFAIMPFFRAEPSHTTRHISEGKQLEFETALFGDWQELLMLEETVLRAIVSHIDLTCSEELQQLDVDLSWVKQPSQPFPKLSFQEAQDLYFQLTGKDERQEPDLSPHAEKVLGEWVLRTHKIPFLFVTHWKREKRPFYSCPNEHNPSLTNTFDLLCGGLEISSGGQRRHTYQAIYEGILEKGMEPAGFDDYLSIFKYGMPPHGGFGIGLERLTMTLLELKNIREASLFPSDTKRIASQKIKARVFFGQETLKGEILRRCRSFNFQFQHLTHAPTPTATDSAQVRKTSLSEGIKALIVRGKKSHNNYQFNIPSDRKLDMRAVSSIVQEKCEFESPEIIESRFGLQIGGIPPFGNLLNIPNYFDESIQKLSQVAFNCGVPTESMIMNQEDLLQITDPLWGSFSKI